MFRTKFDFATLHLILYSTSQTCFAPDGCKRKIENFPNNFFNNIMLKKERIEIRLSKIDKLILVKKATKSNLSLSQYVLSCAMNLEIKNRLSADEIECYQTLTKYSNNFRRIANLFKLGDTTGVKETAIETAKLIREHLLKLK
ncbi:Hypothetical protein FPSM_01853 [Flavobacterium psychrophilum]|nr:Hypothetical protein FPSM_01853 [Flavobacterium psychrophilum]